MDQDFMNELRLAVVQSAEKINNLFESFTQETIKKIQKSIIDETRLGRKYCLYKVFSEFTRTAHFNSGQSGEMVEMPLSIFDFKEPEKLNAKFSQILNTWAKEHQIEISYKWNRDTSNRQYLSVSLNWSEPSKEITNANQTDSSDSGWRPEMKSSIESDYD